MAASQTSTGPVRLDRYLGNNGAMFICPRAKSDKVMSYGYNGLLIRADGNGVKEKDITAPTEVGVVCDADHGRPYPNGGFVGGGGLQANSIMAMNPAPRHSGGTVVGYADGHAIYISNGYNPKDLSDGVTRAFDMAGALGYIDNFTGGISDFPVNSTSQNSITVGGEPCTRPLLLAAAGVWHAKAKAPIVPGGFHGQYAMKKRGADYLWGIGDGMPPTGPAVPIARDQIVVIIAKSSHLKSIDELRNDSVPVWDMAKVCSYFALGSQINVIQAYTFDDNSGTRRFFTTHLDPKGPPVQFGPNTITVKDDYDMVQKVAADPYGIGYCSSSAADPNRVEIVGLKTPDGKVHYFPQNDAKSRWIMPAAPPDWPLVRTLYAEYGGKAWRPDGSGIANIMLAPGAPGTKALQAGPLYKASYWTPAGP